MLNSLCVAFTAVAKAVLDRCICTSDSSNQEDKNGMNKSESAGRRLVKAIPKAVLNHCMSSADSDTQEDKNIKKTKGYNVEFNYEYLDDYRDKCATAELAGLDDDSSVDPEPRNKGFVAKWGPEVFSRNHHPLALMVSCACIQPYM